MGFIKEPEGVDFIINSEPLTQEQEEKLSEFIAKRKLEIAKMKKRKSDYGGSPTKAGGSPPESKRKAKTKHKSEQ